MMYVDLLAANIWDTSWKLSYAADEILFGLHVEEFSLA